MNLPDPIQNSPPPSARRLLFGATFLGVSFAAAMMMVLEHMVGMSLPGCGPGSKCAQAAASAFGKVPWLGLSTASVGAAYFIALLIAWLSSQGSLSVPLRWIVRLGVAVSILLVIVLIVNRQLCPYCLIVHAGHFAFWLVAEVARSQSTADRSASAAAGARFALPSTLFASVFAIAIGALIAAETLNKKAILQREGVAFDESTQQIIQQTRAADDAIRHEEPFTGRWRLGPEDAPIRIVIISDFQCDDCKMIEEQARLLVSHRDDVSLSAKHFPMSTQCNPRIGQDIHPNACWAARAAEAAGILRGNDGFWHMHKWLFDREGSFTDAELHQALGQMGYNAQEFIQLMLSEKTLKPVQQDIDEAVSLGLFFTPMIFINGHELRGWKVPNALSNAVERLAATNPPRRTAHFDRPDDAFGKHIRDWQENNPFPPALTAGRWVLNGEATQVSSVPAARILVLGDYTLDAVVKIDEQIRTVMRSARNVQYAYVHFPADKTCNPYIEVAQPPGACQAALLAEAAGHLGGDDAFWKFHELLLRFKGKPSEAAIVETASQSGVDIKDLQLAMRSPDVIKRVVEDISIGRGLVVQGVPTIYVNGKLVPRWHMPGREVLKTIIDRASQ